MYIADLLNISNVYANLILVLITAVYVVLTWRMVREMRRAREAELEPFLIGSLEQFGPVYAKIRIANVGQGPALSVEAKIAVQPDIPELTRVWNTPAMPAGSEMEFVMPDRQTSGQLPTITQLMAEYQAVIIDLSWKSPMGRKHNRSDEYSLDSLVSGWYQAGQLIPPDEMAEQVKNIQTELKKIRLEMKNISNEIKHASSSTQRLLEQTISNQHVADPEDMPVSDQAREAQPILGVAKIINRFWIRFWLDCDCILQLLPHYTNFTHWLYHPPFRHSHKLEITCLVKIARVYLSTGDLMSIIML